MPMVSCESLHYHLNPQPLTTTMVETRRNGRTLRSGARAASNLSLSQVQPTRRASKKRATTTKAPAKKTRNAKTTTKKRDREDDESEQDEEIDELDAVEEEKRESEKIVEKTPRPKRRRNARPESPVTHVEEAALEEEERSTAQPAEPEDNEEEQGDESTAATGDKVFVPMPFDSISGSQPPSPRETRQAKRHQPSSRFITPPPPDVVIVRRKVPSKGSDSRSNTGESRSRSVTAQSDQPPAPAPQIQAALRSLSAIREEEEEQEAEDEQEEGIVGDYADGGLAEDVDEEHEVDVVEAQAMVESEDEETRRDEEEPPHFEDDLSDNDHGYYPTSSEEEDEGLDDDLGAPEGSDHGEDGRHAQKRQRKQAGPKTSTKSPVRRSAVSRGKQPAHRSQKRAGGDDKHDTSGATKQQKVQRPVRRSKDNTSVNNLDNPRAERGSGEEGSDEDGDGDGVEDGDGDGDQGATGYKRGPLSDEVKTEAEKIYQTYYNAMMKLADDAEKPHEAIFAHVNDVKADSERAPNPWNAFLAFYNAESDDKKPDDWTPQQWTTHICDIYKQTVASRVDEEDRNDPAVVREAMSDYIEWQEERLANYIEGQKADPAKSKRMLHTVLGPFLKQAQHAWITHGVHVGGYALVTRNNNTSMGPGIAWGVGPEYVAVREAYKAQVSRYLEDMSAAYHVQQMGASQHSVSVMRLFSELRTKAGEAPRERDRRVLAKIYRFDTEELVGKQIAPNSFVNTAFKHKLVIRNWPTGVSVPGVGGFRLTDLSPKALRAIIAPREEFLTKTMNNSLRADDKCNKHFKIEKWDHDLTNLRVYGQRELPLVTDVDGKTLVKAEGSKSYQDAMAKLASDSEEEVPPPPPATKKGRKAAQAKTTTAPPTLPLFADDDEEDSPRQSEAPASKQVPPAKTARDSLPSSHTAPPPLPQPRRPPPTTTLNGLCSVTSSCRDSRPPPPPVNLHTKPRSSGSIHPPPIIAPTVPTPGTATMARYEALKTRNAALPSLPWLPENHAKQSKQLAGDDVEEADYHTADLTNITGQMRKYEREQRERLDAEEREQQERFEEEQKRQERESLYWETYSGAPAEPPMKKRKLGESVPGQQASQSRPTAPLPRRVSVERHPVVMPGTSQPRAIAPSNATSGRPQAFASTPNAIAGPPSQPHCLTSNAAGGPSTKSRTPNGRAASSRPPTHPLLDLKHVLKPRK
ncbi:hypothetical protein V5O48_013408 [Marasmius crinis-equi]|uniref:Uncharacterized protein n=1 Tax=Marasmius crinis-equi TaxID=585013 RepID=A0ABR3F066_9AGAR